MISDNLNCDGCPALPLRDIDASWKRQCEKLRQEEVNSVSKIRLFLLCESIPANRFVYDMTSDYSQGGLRFNLRNELVNGGSDKDLFEYLRNLGVVIVDCALCPLHKLDSNKARREAATICLERHTHIYLDLYPKAPIMTIFPSKFGFLRRRLPNIGKRVEYEFQFTDLKGLRDAIDGLMRDNQNIPDKELLEACCGGDRNAISTLHERFKNLIYSAIHKWINKYADATDREEDVKDVFNEAILNIMENNFAKLRQARDPNKLSALVFIIAYQTAGRYFEEKWKERKKKVEGLIPDTALGTDNPFEELARKEEMELVGEFLSALKPLEQKVMELRYGDRLSYRRIATRLELSTAHVGVIINRVKEKLGIFIRERYGKPRHF